MSRLEQMIRFLCFVLEQTGVGLTFAVIALAGIDGQSAGARAALVLAAIFGLAWSGFMRRLRQGGVGMGHLELAWHQPPLEALAILSMMLSLMALSYSPAFGTGVQLAMQTGVLVLGGIAWLSLGVPGQLVRATG